MAINNQNKETLINLISNMFSFAVSVLIGFFLSPYIIKNLGAEANGYTHLANNFVTYASLITTALNSMAGRFMSIEYHRGNLDELKKYYSSVIISNVVIIIALVLPAAYIVLNLENVIKISAANIVDVKMLFGFVFINFFVSQISSIYSTALYVRNKLIYQNIIALGTSLLRVCLILFLFGFFEAQMYYVSLTGLILTILSLPFYFILKQKLLTDAKIKVSAFKIRYVIKLVGSGIWNTINQCGNMLMVGLDLLLTNIFINPLEMGILSVAKTIPNYIIQLGNMVNHNFSPSLTITYASNDKDEMLKNLRWAMKLSSILMSIPLSILMVFGDAFYKLWVPSLDSEKLVITSILSCLTFIPLSGTQVLSNVYTAANKLKLNSIAVIIGGVINFIVVYILLKCTDLGIFAVAGVSSVVSIVRSLTVTIPYATRLLKLKWYEFYKDVGISCLCCFCVVIVSFLVKYIININSWFELIVAIFASCLIGFCAEMVLLLTKSERKALINKLKKE